MTFDTFDKTIPIFLFLFALFIVGALARQKKKGKEIRRIRRQSIIAWINMTLTFLMMFVGRHHELLRRYSGVTMAVAVLWMIFLFWSLLKSEDRHESREADHRSSLDA